MTQSYLLLYLKNHWTNPYFSKNHRISTKLAQECQSDGGRRSAQSPVLRAAGAHPVERWTRLRQKSERTMFRIYNERRRRKARSQDGGRTYEHTRSPEYTGPNTQRGRAAAHREERMYPPSSGTRGDRTPGVSDEVFETLVACPRWMDHGEHGGGWAPRQRWRDSRRIKGRRHQDIGLPTRHRPGYSS